MMANNAKRNKVARMTLLAMLVAVLIVLAFVNIPMPMGLSITFNMIPVAIAVMAMGLPGGMIVGGAFGLISFLQCFGIFGSSALGAALVNYSPVLMFIQRFISRLLVGVLAALVYKGMGRTRAPLYVRGAITGFSAAFFNTLFFMGLLVLLFGNTPELSDKIAAKGVLMYIITSVGINAVVEMGVAAVVTGAAGAALKKARLI
uniref:Putative membrane protein n=1 Tax=uncultured bacterium Contig11 TaxID=1393376 RepID=W0FKK6_9BACT|nr:putative membrane protein [uncultured bacterium Contig11]